MLNNLGKSSFKNKAAQKSNSNLKTALGIGGGAGAIAAASALTDDNTTRLNSDFGHVGSVFGMHETSIASVGNGVPLSYVGFNSYPMQEDAKVLKKVKRVLKK